MKKQTKLLVGLALGLTYVLMLILNLPNRDAVFALHTAVTLKILI